MHIAFVVSQFPCLSESFIVQQAVGLLKLGHTINIIAFGPSDQPVTQKEIDQYRLLDKTTYITLPKKKSKLRWKGFKDLTGSFLRYPIATLRLLQYFKESGGFSYPSLFLASHCLRERFDIIHAHFGPMGIKCSILKKIRISGKLVTSLYGYDISTFVNQHGKEVYRDLFELGDIFIYISETGKKKIIALGCSESKMHKNPMGIDVSDFKFKERVLTENQEIRILSVGRLVEMKGREYAIRAIAELKDKYPIHYDIVGDGPLRQELQSLIEDLNLNDTVRLWGWASTEQRDELYERAHLFVHPSVTSSDGNQEGQGVVLLEAQAHGIPVIATRHGAFPDSVRDGQTAFLVPEKDVQALKGVIEKLIQHASDWPKIGHCGRLFVSGHFDSKRLNERLVEIYNQILKNHA